MPLQHILTFGHFAMMPKIADCSIILTLVCAEIVSLLHDRKNSLLPSPVGRPLSLTPLPGSIDKGISSLLEY